MRPSVGSKTTLNMAALLSLGNDPVVASIYICAATGNATELAKYIATGHAVDECARVYGGPVTRYERPLHAAAMNGRVDCARLLVASGCRANTPDSERRTALRRAVDRGHASMVAVLLDGGGGDVDERDRDGGSLAHVAVARGDANTLEALLDAGHALDVPAGARLFFHPPLGLALSRGDAVLAEVLMRRGASVETGGARTEANAAAFELADAVAAEGGWAAFEARHRPITRRGLASIRALALRGRAHTRLPRGAEERRLHELLFGVEGPPSRACRRSATLPPRQLPGAAFDDVLPLIFSFAAAPERRRNGGF